MRGGGSKVKSTTQGGFGCESGERLGREPEELLRSEPKGGRVWGRVILPLVPRSHRGQQDMAQRQTGRERTRTENKDGLRLWARYKKLQGC